MLSQNIDVKLVDHLGNSAVFYEFKVLIIKLLARLWKRVVVEIKTNASRVFRAIVEEDLDLLHVKFGDNFEYKDN